MVIRSSSRPGLPLTKAPRVLSPLLRASVGPCLALLLVGIPAAAGADDVRRYVDDEGVVHISVEGQATAPRGAGSAMTPRPSGGNGGESRSVRETRIRALVTEAARYYQLPEPLVLAVIRVESNFSPMAVSHAGALGLMQLMPATAQSMYVRDPFDSRENIFGGCRFLRLLLNRFDGDLVLTLAAYNAGETAVLRREGVPYAETADYVRMVLAHYDRYRRAELGQ